MSTKLVLALAGVAALVGVATAGPNDAWVKPAKDQKWTPLDPKAGDKGPQMTVVFGDPAKKGAPIGILLHVPPGFKPGPHTHTSDDYVVIVEGSAHNFSSPGTDEGPGLTVGGTWFQPAGKPHDNHCDESAKTGCTMFVYMAKGFDIKPWVDPKAAKKDEPKKDAPKKDAPKPDAPKKTP